MCRQHTERRPASPPEIHTGGRRSIPLTKHPTNQDEPPPPANPTLTQPDTEEPPTTNTFNTARRPVAPGRAPPPQVIIPAGGAKPERSRPSSRHSARSRLPRDDQLRPWVGPLQIITVGPNGVDISKRLFGPMPLSEFDHGRVQCGDKGVTASRLAMTSPKRSRSSTTDLFIGRPVRAVIGRPGPARRG